MFFLEARAMQWGRDFLLHESQWIQSWRSDENCWICEADWLNKSQSRLGILLERVTFWVSDQKTSAEWWPLLDLNLHLYIMGCAFLNLNLHLDIYPMSLSWFPSWDSCDLVNPRHILQAVWGSQSFLKFTMIWYPVNLATIVPIS
jgi:hypothetical protein